MLVRDGRPIASRRNRTNDWTDATTHAEMVTFRAAARTGDPPEFNGATPYSTQQPCGMCTIATIWTKLQGVVFGAGRDDVRRMYFENRNFDAMDLVRDAYLDHFYVESGCHRKEITQLYFRLDDVIKDQKTNLQQNRR